MLETTILSKLNIGYPQRGRHIACKNISHSNLFFHLIRTIISRDLIFNSRMDKTNHWIFLTRALNFTTVSINSDVIFYKEMVTHRFSTGYNVFCKHTSGSMKRYFSLLLPTSNSIAMWCLSIEAPWYAEFDIWVSSNRACFIRRRGKYGKGGGGGTTRVNRQRTVSPEGRHLQYENTPGSGNGTKYSKWRASQKGKQCGW